MKSVGHMKHGIKVYVPCILQSLIVVHLMNIILDHIAVVSTFKNTMKLKILFYHLWDL
jgi:hypothetical protein